MWQIEATFLFANPDSIHTALQNISSLLFRASRFEVFSWNLLRVFPVLMLHLRNTTAGHKMFLSHHSDFALQPCNINDICIIFFAWTISQMLLPLQQIKWCTEMTHLTTYCPWNRNSLRFGQRVPLRKRRAGVSLSRTCGHFYSLVGDTRNTCGETCPVIGVQWWGSNLHRSHEEHKEQDTRTNGESTAINVILTQIKEEHLTNKH